MKRKDEFLGSINDFKKNTVMLLFYEPTTDRGSLVISNKRFGYGFEKKEDVSELIELLKKLKKKLKNP